MLLDPRLQRLQAKEDFNKAKSRANLDTLINRFAPERRELLSFEDVKELVKPGGESYKGMRAVAVSQITGSEGRYRDFTRAFLPKREMLRHRWESVDRAYLGYVDLPPIRLYEIGGVYFVRDGNHRVSVAKTQGIERIDAEIVSLKSKIVLKPGMTKLELKNEVIRFEQQQVFSQTELGEIVNPDEIVFTATGRYFELIKHIEVHKYFINQDREDEISFLEAARSWNENLFAPIINLLSEQKIHRRFPGRTKADLYMWMIRHWDELKRSHGSSYPLEAAVSDYSSRFGKNFGQRVMAILRRIFP
jgi:hypothetical protein